MAIASPLRIDEHIPLLEDILAPWKHDIGRDYPGYRNHVYRMVHFCFALPECVPDWNDDARRKVIIAGCFHDLGIWSDRTFDYLPPSIVRAAAYLKEHALDAWTPEVELMIASHHKLRRFTDGRYPLVEAFRRADLIDVSLGLVKFGLSGAVRPRGQAALSQPRIPQAARATGRRLGAEPSHESPAVPEVVVQCLRSSGNDPCESRDLLISCKKSHRALLLAS